MLKAIPSKLLSVFTVLVALGTLAACAPDDGMGLDPLAHTGPEPIVYTVDLMPLNDSGVSGTATLTLEQLRGKGQSLTVHIEASGLEPSMLHPQHIHGFKNAKKNAVCPPEEAQDNIAGLPEQASNPDEFISVEEGLPFYGPILLPLTPFPTTPDGTIDFTETYSNSELKDLQPIRTTLTNRHIVLHGMTINGTYVATLPVACGQIEVAD